VHLVGFYYKNDIQNYPFPHATPWKERRDMTPRPTFTSGNMSVLILIRMMHDHICRTLLINLSPWLIKNHTMKAHGGVKAWLHTLLPSSYVLLLLHTWLQYLLTKWLGESHSQCEHYPEQKNLLPMPRTEHRCSWFKCLNLAFEMLI